MIKIQNLSKKYKDFYALKDINLTLPSKGLIGISGESGSGKSTLLNAIALMDNKYQGEIIINKRNILKYSDHKKDKYHLNIGYIFQTPSLFNFCTVKENVQYLSLIKGKKYKIDDILKIVGLDKYKNKKVNELSGGQRQRVSIAASLISKPKLLLCDEPTGALDSENSRKVMEILKEISKETLVIVVSHDLKLLNEYADSIIYLKDGKLVNQINYQSSNLKFKFTKKNTISYLVFLLKFAFKNIFSHQKRTLLTSIMVSFGLIGIILSILLKDGFSSFFENSLGGYDSNKYLYCYNINNNDKFEVELDTFEDDFKDYNKGYFYKYNFKENKDNYRNKISINNIDLYLNFNDLSYLMIDNYSFNDKEIGICCSSDYIDYLCYLLKVNNLNQLNKYLKKNNIQINFEYLDTYINLNFKLKLTYIKESKNDYIYFIHSSPLFLKKYFNKYLSSDLSLDNKIVILPYIESEEKDKTDLLLNEQKKKYDYLFDNKIYNKEIDFVFKSNYYRIDIELAKKMSELINSNYYLAINNGIDTMGYFSENIKISSDNKEINGREVSFSPKEDNYNSILEISISRGLYNLLDSQLISIEGYGYCYDLFIKDIVENDNLVIYQNSYWSYSLFKDLFNFNEYDCIGLSIGFSKSDDQSIELLSNNFSDFEFICPLKEVKKEIEGMVDKIQLILVVLSSFCIIISILLMAIMIFINTIEQSKLIALLRINGISKIDVISIFIIESILLGVISFIIASYFSFVFTIELNLVFNSLLNKKGLEIIVLKKDILINVFKLVMIMSLISSLIPSFLASKKKIIKFLKN